MHVTYRGRSLQHLVDLDFPFNSFYDITLSDIDFSDSLQMRNFLRAIYNNNTITTYLFQASKH